MCGAVLVFPQKHLENGLSTELVRLFLKHCQNKVKRKFDLKNLL